MSWCGTLLWCTTTDKLYVVWGTEPDSARDFVSSLLEDPLSGDDIGRSLLGKRHGEQDAELRISYANKH